MFGVALACKATGGMIMTLSSNFFFTLNTNFPFIIFSFISLAGTFISYTIEYSILKYN